MNPVIFIHWRVCAGRKLRSKKRVKCVESVNTPAVGAKLSEKLGYTHACPTVTTVTGKTLK